MKENIEEMLYLLDNYGPEVKLSIVKFIVGLIVADGVIHDAEKKYLLPLIEQSLDDSDVLKEIFKILQDKKFPHLKKINIDSSVAERILRLILNICACDDDLHYKEVIFAKRVGSALGITRLRIHGLLDQTVFRLKTESFDKLLGGLDEDERYWLAVVILKVIFADEKVHIKEYLYFSDIYDLVKYEDTEMLFEKVKEGPNQLKLEELPPVDFGSELSLRILKYLLCVSMIDSFFDYREHLLIQKVAQILKCEDQLEDLILSVKALWGIQD